MHYNFIISIYVTDNQFCNSLSTVNHDKKVTDTLFNQRSEASPFENQSAQIHIISMISRKVVIYEPVFTSDTLADLSQLTT